MPFWRRHVVTSSAGASHAYIRFVAHVRTAGRRRQRVVIDMGNERDLPTALASLAAFLGPATFHAYAGTPENLAEIAAAWDTLSPSARAKILAAIAAEALDVSQKTKLEQRCSKDAALSAAEPLVSMPAAGLPSWFATSPPTLVFDPSLSCRSDTSPALPLAAQAG